MKALRDHTIPSVKSNTAEDNLINSKDEDRRILIAEDDPVSRLLLEKVLKKLNCDVVVCSDGQQAWESLAQDNAPRLAVLDWMMPGFDGVDICKKVRESASLKSIYIILLTARGSTDNIVEGLKAGANDYLTKPFVRAELLARVQVGFRVLNLQNQLSTRVTQLENALAQVKRLQGLVPMCCVCKKIRDDKNYWQEVETYVSDHSEAEFTHGICPPCSEDVYGKD